MFEREIINMGAVPKGIQQKVTVKYIGQEPFETSEMRTSCSCTAASFDPETKEVSFSFTPRVSGEFSVTATYKNQYYITVKAEVS